MHIQIIIIFFLLVVPLLTFMDVPYLTYIVTYISFLLISFATYVFSQESKYQKIYAWLVLVVVIFDICTQNMILLSFIAIWSLTSGVDVAINLTQSIIALRYVLSQFLLALINSTLSSITAISFIISFFIFDSKRDALSLHKEPGLKLLLAVIAEILTGFYVLIHYQSNLLLLMAIINYILIFIMLTKESFNVTDKLLFLNGFVCIYAICFAHTDLWIIVYHVTHTIFVVCKYDDMQKSKFIELLSWCKSMNFSPHFMIKTDFSLLIYLLLDYQKNYSVPHFFIGDKERPKKNFEFGYDNNGIVVFFDRNLKFKHSKRYQQMLQNYKVRLQPYGLIHLERIFTFKIYKLIQLLMYEHVIYDVAHKINIWYMALIRRDMFLGLHYQ
uniref:Uncharacterized protein n=1 Tax=viral metagenome TaxID=1070528 RepID=A0A6C0C9C1_9ZZZZ